MFGVYNLQLQTAVTAQQPKQQATRWQYLGRVRNGRLSLAWCVHLVPQRHCQGALLYVAQSGDLLTRQSLFSR